MSIRGIMFACLVLSFPSNAKAQFDIIAPELASKADMACASITGYALTRSEDKIVPLLKLCSENPHKNVCDITVSLMKDLHGGRGGTYGLMCSGGLDN
ncbi:MULTISPECIES: hypothetical protein [Bradyrhizobium]|uniref:hypothetical protein n=1 Tax=Bradyrhizobium TaxID=374 RepID=UPI001EDA75D3|nr:hypothetical protein [Bradyrhizobium zhengyangense]MCG2645526.1 hypothetical protein [Bradyrhizobium zhengyangense]